MLTKVDNMVAVKKTMFMNEVNIMHHSFASTIVPLQLKGVVLQQMFGQISESKKKKKKNKKKK